MTDFLFFILSPALLTITAILLRHHPGWQVSTTVALGVLLLSAINFEVLHAPFEGWRQMMGWLLLDGGPILAVAGFLVIAQWSGAKGPGIVLVGVPVSYLLGFGVAVQIGMLLGLVQP